MFSAIFLLCALAAANASDMSHKRLNSLLMPGIAAETKPVSTCQPFGFDNDLACLFCSYEELLPILHAERQSAVTSSMIASSAACIKNMCEACVFESSCLVVNGKSLAPFCPAAELVSSPIHIDAMPDLADLEIAASSSGLSGSSSGDFSGSASGSAEFSGSSSGDDSFLLFFVVSFYRFVTEGSGFAIDSSSSSASASGSGFGSAAFESSSSSSSSGDFSGVSGSGSGVEAEAPHTSSSHARKSTTATTPATTTTSTSSQSTSTAFTMTTPSAQVAPNTAQITQTITLFGVCPMKFKLMYLLNALALTLNVPITSIYAQVNDDALIMARSIAPISLTYVIVTPIDQADQIIATLTNVSDSTLLLNLQAQSPSLVDATIAAGSVEVVSNQTAHFCILTMVAVGAAGLLAVIAVIFFITISCRRGRRSTYTAHPVGNDKDYVKYDLLPANDYGFEPTTTRDTASDDELMA